MDRVARVGEMGRAGQPVGIAFTGTKSGWVAACSDTSAFALSTALSHRVR